MRTYRKPRPLINKVRQEISQLENGSTDGTDVHDIDSHLKTNERALTEIFVHCSDIVYRHISDPLHDLLLIYVDGLLDTKHLDDVILKPLLFDNLTDTRFPASETEGWIKRQSIPIGETKVVFQIQDIVSHVLKGDLAILNDGEECALVASIKGWSKRSIDEPNSEQVIRGPREGFVETVRVNTSMLRRKIHSSKLKMESLTLGHLSQTDIVIVYIDGIVRSEVLKEVRARLNRIQIDGVLESGYIEEFIQDATYSPFPTVQNTERPDVLAANLLEGKVGILVDGTPFALIAPMTFWGALQANEDYYERAIIGTVIRWLRLGMGFVALALPSLYVALISFQQEMVPTTFLITIAKSQEATPFPAVVEAFVMEIMFEALREAGVRLPKAVGSAVSIVGALVLGEAAVQAGVISAPMVIVVATTGIASFTIPRFNLGIGIRMLRFPLLALAGTFGFFGITIGFLLILLHVASLRSFGAPYFAPLGPLKMSSLGDTLVRTPWWNMKNRPQTSTVGAQERVPHGQKPGPQQGEA